MDELENAVGALAGQGGDEEDRGIAHEAQVPHDVLAHLLHRARLFFHEIPLVDDDDAGLARLVRKPRDLRVLVGDAVARVDQDEAHVRPLDGELRAHDRELLHPLVHLGLAADAGGVDEEEFAVLVFKGGVHGVARRARHVGDDDALLAEDAVQKRGLAHVRLADDGDLDAVVLPLLLVGLGEILEALVQQIAGAVPVHGGDGDRVAEAERVKFIHAHVGRAGGVGLVDGQYHGLLRAQQHVRHVLVRRGHAGAQVGHQHDDRRRVDRDLRLLAHKEQDLAVGRRLDAAGVDHIKFPPAPLAFGVEPVAGDARGVLHDGQALPHQAVKQHGFAHIGPPHDGDQGS